MRKKLIIFAVLICLCAAAFGALILVDYPPRLDSKARKQWKAKAVSELADQTRDTGLVQKELSTMKSKRPAESSEWDGWISEDLILMTNGDWMAYRSICQ